MKTLSIPLNDEERNEIFEADPEACARAREALRLVRAGTISGPRFLRLMSNYRGLALERFVRRCVELARREPLKAGRRIP